jgi:hypothetical protein
MMRYSRVFDPANDLHIVVTFSSDATNADSARLIIEVMGVLVRLG